ncbi:hypothetical protein ACFLU5_06835 [Bacteroidota bacterium]
MKIVYQNSQEYLNKLIQTVNFLAAIPMIAFVILFIKIENNEYNPDILRESGLFFFRFLTFILVSGIIGIAIFQFRSNLKIIRDMGDLRSKLDNYHLAVRNRSWWFEAATILALAGMAISGEGIHALFYSMALVAFSIFYPTILKIANNLRLEGSDREIMLKQKDIPW